jgi:hypothetical protein
VDRSIIKCADYQQISRRRFHRGIHRCPIALCRRYKGRKWSTQILAEHCDTPPPTSQVSFLWHTCQPPVRIFVILHSKHEVMALYRGSLIRRCGPSFFKRKAGCESPPAQHCLSNISRQGGIGFLGRYTSLARSERCYLDSGASAGGPGQ